MLEAQNLRRLTALRHGFFTREGGVSEGLYAGLNCGPGSGDAPEAVAENQRRAMARLGPPAPRLALLHQYHSAVCIALDAVPAERPRADAAVTARPGLALGILTADCLPVLLADPKAGVIGAAHAGWRGALEGVLEATIETMVALGARPPRIAAALGPAIAWGSYEVGPEFPEPFIRRDPRAEACFKPAPRAGHWLFDLKGYAAGRLVAAGLAPPEVLASDTYGEEGLFFSYRRACHRGEADYGRDLSAIALIPAE